MMDERKRKQRYHWGPVRPHQARVADLLDRPWAVGRADLPSRPVVRVKWQPRKPRERIEIVECGPGCWDEQDHCLDIPHAIDTVDFRVTGTGHERIEKAFHEGCINRRRIVGFNAKQPEHRIADWLCRYACSFVLFDSKARATVMGFEREEDAAAFRGFVADGF